MRKVGTFILFLLLVQSITYAQSDFRIGLFTGPALSFMHANTDEISTSGINLGIGAGFIGEVYFRENYAFLTGLCLDFNNGGKLRYASGGNIWDQSTLPAGVPLAFPQETELKYSIMNMEIPLGLKMRTNEIGYLRYFMDIPVVTLGFRMNSTGSIQFDGFEESDIDIKNEVNAFALRVGMNMGIEYSIAESTSVICKAGFNYTFTDIIKNSGEKINILGFPLGMGLYYGF